jgi:hypothetical protein
MSRRSPDIAADKLKKEEIKRDNNNNHNNNKEEDIVSFESSFDSKGSLCSDDVVPICAIHRMKQNIPR